MMTDKGDKNTQEAHASGGSPTWVQKLDTVKISFK